MPQTWEAEHRSVGRRGSGARFRVVEDETASGGAWVLFYAAKPGDFIEFTLPDMLPGRYILGLRYKGHAERGTCQVSLGEADGSGHTPIGAPLDMNRPEGWHEAAIGSCTIGRAGFRTVRLTVTGSSGEHFKLSVDRLTFTPAFERELAAPSGLTVTGARPNHCVLSWRLPAVGATGFLVQRRGGKTDEWRLVGTVPGNATRFAAAGLCDESTYAFRICAYTRPARSAWSAPCTVETPPGNHAMRGRAISTAPGRIGGATMLLRDDGSILMYAHYQERLRDQGRFEIHEMTSSDRGETWTERRPLLAAPDRTYMMPALLRLRNGDVLFCYTERDLALTWGKRFCKRSTDGGLTWSEPVLATADLPLTRDEFVLSMPTGPHDRLVQTRSGRVLFPVHFPWIPGKGHDERSRPRVICPVVYTSDDAGRTWRRACEPMLVRGMTRGSARHRDLQGLWEPSIVEVAPRHLLMYMRSNTGWYVESRSEDDGTTWSAPIQSPFRAPLCPARLVRLDGARTGIIFNGIFDYGHANLGRRWDLATMVSSDGGRTWSNCRSVEFRDPADVSFGLFYCYPSVLFDGDRLHMTYYGPAKGRQFNLIYRRLPATWFTD